MTFGTIAGHPTSEQLWGREAPFDDRYRPVSTGSLTLGIIPQKTAPPIEATELLLSSSAVQIECAGYDVRIAANADASAREGERYFGVRLQCAYQALLRAILDESP